MLMILSKVKSSSTVFPGENGTKSWSSAVKAFVMESIGHSLVTESLSWGLQEVHLECSGAFYVCKGTKATFPRYERNNIVPGTIKNR